MPPTKHMNRWRVTGILWTLLLPPCSSANSSELLIQTNAGTHAFEVITATSQYEQLNGLQGWVTLARNEGMLFVFPEMTQRPFWMKHISIPLDILFIDSNGKIVDIVHHAEPGSEKPLVADNSFLATLEVNANTVSQMGIAKGDRVCHPLIASTANVLPE